MLLSQISEYIIQAKNKKKLWKNIKYQLQRSMINLYYIIYYIKCKIFKIILSILLKIMKQ